MEQITIREKHGDIPRGRMITPVKKSNPQKPRGRILVVDDEPQVAETLQDLLMFAGFDVEVAGNGREAIERLTTARHFDLMISDMRMPKMDGLELLRLSHQLRRYLPVVILTAYATVDNGIHALEEGAYDYILKPFNTEKLLRVIEGALARRLLPLGTA